MHPACSRENSYDTDVVNEYLRGHTVYTLSQVCHVPVVTWFKVPFQFE